MFSWVYTPVLYIDIVRKLVSLFHQVVKLLLNRKREGYTGIYTTHDSSYVVIYADSPLAYFPEGQPVNFNI